MTELTFADHLIFFLFGIVFPANAIFRAQPLLKSIDEWTTEMKLVFYRSNGAMLWLMAIVAVAVTYFSGRSLAELGFQLPQEGTWGSSLLLAATFLMAYGLDAWLEIASPQARRNTVEEWRANTPFLPETRRELRAFYGLAFSAAVGEEILFRGYFITYMLAILGTTYPDKVAAIGIPTAIFAFSHFYQGWKAILKIAVLSVAFGFLFLISGSLLLPVVLHLIVDVVGGVLAFRLLKREG